MRGNICGSVRIGLLALVVILGFIFTPLAQAHFICAESLDGTTGLNGGSATATGSTRNVACGTSANASGNNSANGSGAGSRNILPSRIPHLSRLWRSVRSEGRFLAGSKTQGTPESR